MTKAIVISGVFLAVLVPLFPANAANDPNLSFSIDPTSITKGETATLTWFGTNIRGCSGYGDWSESFYASNDIVAGNRQVKPSEHSTYGLSCFGEGGVVRKEVSINVSAPGTTSYTYSSVASAQPAIIYAPPSGAGLQAPSYNTPLYAPSYQYVTPQKLTAGCAASPTLAAKGEKVTFVGSYVGGSGTANYSWSGDISGTGKIIDKIFSETGTKTANLTVTDTAGAQAAAQCSSVVSGEKSGGAERVLGAASDKSLAAADNGDEKEDKTCDCAKEPTESVKGEIDAPAEPQLASVGRAQSFVLWFILALTIINFGFVFYLSARVGKLEKKHPQEEAV